MKTLRNVIYQDGTRQGGWKFGTFKKAWNCGGNIQGNGRLISGWTIVSPDGVERNCEGNWQQFVPFANMVLENYGCNPMLS